jgi:hypothetical protein
MSSVVVYRRTDPTILEVRERIAARERALARIPRRQYAPQLFPDTGGRARVVPLPPPTRRVRPARAASFSLAENTQQVKRASWMADCLTMAVTLLNIALWAVLLSLW